MLYFVSFVWSHFFLRASNGSEKERKCVLDSSGGRKFFAKKTLFIFAANKVDGWSIVLESRNERNVKCVFVSPCTTGLTWSLRLIRKNCKWHSKYLPEGVIIIIMLTSLSWGKWMKGKKRRRKAWCSFEKRMKKSRYMEKSFFFLLFSRFYRYCSLFGLQFLFFCSLHIGRCCGCVCAMHCCKHCLVSADQNGSSRVIIQLYPHWKHCVFNVHLNVMASESCLPYLPAAASSSTLQSTPRPT